MKNRILTVITLSFLVSGCDKAEPPKTVQWYKQNPAELSTVYSKCKESGEDSDNCRNAKQAHFDIQQKDAPILDLNHL